MWPILFSDCCTHLDVGDEEIEAAVEAAAGITTGAVDL